MKYRKIIIALIAINLGACDITTRDQSTLDPATALNNTSGVQSAILSAYRRVWEFNLWGQQANLHGDAFADNLEIANNTGRYQQEIVNAVGVYADRWGSGTPGFGEGCYGIVKDANYAIAFIPKLNISTVPSSVTVTSQQVLDHLTAEAKFLRALAYFELSRVYSYEPGKEQNGFNLGAVLRLDPTLTVSNASAKPRSTNLETYQQMEKDLQDAYGGLLAQSQVAGWPTALGTNAFPYRATKAAAAALLARVYLYWGRYADADIQATAALSQLITPPPVNTAGFVGSWSGIPHPESIFEAQIIATDFSGVDGQNNSLNSITTNMLGGGSQYAVAASAELYAAHEVGDIRKSMYVVSAATLNKPQCRKWPGEKGSYVENIPILRKAEMYLIQAESRARTGSDVTAQSAINTIRTNRGLLATALTGQPLIDLIMNERRVELAFEGHRFYDLKRLGLPITKTAASNTTILQPNDFRILMQIPVQQIILSGGLLKQNPGY